MAMKFLNKLLTAIGYAIAAVSGLLIMAALFIVAALCQNLMVYLVPTAIFFIALGIVLHFLFGDRL